ncbi:phage tail length tape measure family protein, partial [Roseibium sp. RKSG952]|uniref:phage tail length tape measure family protein n=1 Tax=Roseibium sp. RKSG952 TaxID=2529384 RepID=UPI0013CC376F
MASTEEKLVLLFEAKTNQLERKLNQIERASKQAFNNSRRPLQKFNRDLQKSPRHLSRMQAALRKSAQSAAVLEGPLGGIAGRFSAIGSAVGSINPVVLGAALGLAGFTAAGVKAVNAFEKAETQFLVTEQVIKATGGAAGRTGEQIEELAQGIGMATLASTTEAREAATQLLTFRSIAGDTFDRTLKLSQDLATVGFGTLKSSAVQLGKALEDPEQGLSALRRVGVSFSSAQREMIRNFMETGRVAEAQALILDGVEQQVGGAGAASGGGLAGAYDTLAEATQILLERWGSQIASALNLRDAIMGIAGAVDAVNARAGLSGQIAETTQRIDSTRSKLSDFRATAGEEQSNGGVFNSQRGIINQQAALAAEQELQDLLRQRGDLLRQLDRQRKEQDNAYVQAQEEKARAEQERITTVLDGLNKEIELAGKSRVEREISNKQAQAGVTADSAEGQEIETLVRQAEATRNLAVARGGSARAAGGQADAVQRIIDQLQFELDLMGMSETQKRVMNELRSAGAAATDEERAAIEALIIAQDQASQRQQQAGELSQFAADMMYSQWSALTSQIKTGNEALDQFLQTLAQVALQGAIFGEGPLGGLFGGG